MDGWGKVLSTGKVIRFDEFKGYGFVAPDAGGEDVFIHVNDLDFDKRLMAPGVHVEYVAEEGDRGLKASQVQILDARPPHTAPSNAGQSNTAPSNSGPSSTAATSPVASGATATTAPAGGGYEDVICDVLSPQEFSAEVTEALLASDRALTSAQILAVRGALADLARSHKWIEG